MRVDEIDPIQLRAARSKVYMLYLDAIASCRARSRRERSISSSCSSYIVEV